MTYIHCTKWQILLETQVYTSWRRIPVSCTCICTTCTQMCIGIRHPNLNDNLFGIYASKELWNTSKRPVCLRIIVVHLTQHLACTCSLIFMTLTEIVHRISVTAATSDPTQSSGAPEIQAPSDQNRQLLYHLFLLVVHSIHHVHIARYSMHVHCTHGGEC